MPNLIARLRLWFTKKNLQARIRISGWMESLAGTFSGASKKLTKGIPKDESAVYEALTPVATADEDGIYARRLEWALSKKDIRNIAVTGPYGYSHQRKEEQKSVSKKTL